MSLLTIFLVVYCIAWISFLLAQLFIRRGNKLAMTIQASALNSRVQLFKYPPFSLLFNLWIKRKYFISFLLFFIILMIIDILFILLGLPFVVPILIFIWGGITGLLVGDVKLRNLTWFVLICLFEFGHIALAGSLGLLMAYTVLLSDFTLSQSLLMGYTILVSGYWIPIFLCILGNIFFEAAGPLFWGMSGDPGLVALAKTIE